MKPFSHIAGVAVPMLEDDVNTDQIAPVSGQLNPDYGAFLFARQRWLPDGGPNPDFVLNLPQFMQPRILVVGKNFGCGSSREAAVWGLMGVGIFCLVGTEFSEIFRENCLQNGVLTIDLNAPDLKAFRDEVVEVNGSAAFEIDLPSQSISCPSGTTFTFAISAADKVRLLEGLDDIGLTLKHAEEITAWETRIKALAPCLQTATDARLVARDNGR
jgi:3-isopropylmalate dehydratase small subunit